MNPTSDTWRPRRAALATAVLVSIFTTSAFAQSPARDEQERSGAALQSYQEHLEGADVRVSELVGTQVRSPSGDDLGEIQEVLVGPGPGQDLTLVVSVGGVLGVGDKLIAMPIEELRVAADGEDLYLDRTRDQLAAEPAFTYHHDDPRAAAGDQDGGAVNRPAPPADRTGAPSTAAVAGGQRVHGLLGASVVDSAGEKIGELDDVLISTAGTDGTRAVLSVGGFAGFGAKLVAIPFDDLRVEDEGQSQGALDQPVVRVQMSGDAIRQMPDFEYRAPQRSAGL
jgi:sporulation protein YlmC with PRC-barrel domain